MTDIGAMNRLVRMLPRPSDRYQHKHRAHTGGTLGACGNCPSCGNFVVVERLYEFAGTACPSCGVPVHRLVPLGDGT